MRSFLQRLGPFPHAWLNSLQNNSEKSRQLNKQQNNNTTSIGEWQQTKNDFAKKTEIFNTNIYNIYNTNIIAYTLIWAPHVITMRQVFPDSNKYDG